MKTIAVGLGTSTLWLGSTGAQACPQCRPVVRAGVYNPDFAATVLVLLLPLAVVLLIGIVIYGWDTLISKPRQGKSVES